MEDAMALYDKPHNPADDPLRGMRSRSAPGSVALPLLLAAAVLIALLALFYPAGNAPRVGDTNTAGPSANAVNPSPTPSTSPTVPTPTPTTEPRPTQAPIR
jgi:hypothetical protein